MKLDLNRNVIAWQNGFVLLNQGYTDNTVYAMTFQANLMKRGYLLDRSALDAMCKAGSGTISRIYTDVMTYLDTMTGGGKKYEPIYKNFPSEVMEMDDMEFYFNALLHYWSNGTWTPDSVEVQRKIQLENVKYKMITLGSEDDFQSVFTKLVSVNTSLTPSDLEVIKWYVNTDQPLRFPDSIPFKENLCTLAAMGVQGIPVKTTTDVLRIAVHLSGGDISLPALPKKLVRRNTWSSYASPNPERESFKFKKFTRRERKYLLSLLESSNCDASEMAVRDSRWVRLGEILHPSEYRNLYPKAAAAFGAVRNGEAVTWNSTVERALKYGNLPLLLAVLSERPGEFARRLDMLVRKNKKSVDEIMAAFNAVVDRVSTKVVLEMINHFEKRTESGEPRTIMIKGARKPKVIPSLDPLSVEMVNKVQSSLFESLKHKFAALPPMGSCFVDPELKKIPLPSNMRSSSANLLPVIRGQRLKLRTSDARVVRAFIHWTDVRGNTDLDLSASFVKDEKSPVVLNFSNYKVGNSVHSGDVRHRQGNCAEYVDIDVADALNRGFHYVLIDVRNFNGGSLKSVGGVFGVMGRQYPESNSHWLPETIDNCVMLDSSAGTVAMCIIDLREMEYIMLDVDMTGFPNAALNKGEISKVIAQYIRPPKFSVYDLIMLHVKSHGRLAEGQEIPDTEFWFDDFATNYVKTAELMA